MENHKVTGIVKLFIMHAKLGNILELDKNDLRENFYQLKNNEKYAELLSAYTYDENNICIQLESELNDLVEEKEIVDYKKTFYIYGIHTNTENIYTENNNSLARDMVRDYINLNMQKQKVKMD